MQRLMLYFFLILTAQSLFASEPIVYSDLIHQVRTKSEFFADIPLAGGVDIAYAIELDQSMNQAPSLADFYLAPGGPFFFRTFTDRILLKDGSNIQIGKMVVPATCLFVHGQDNRYSGKDTPLIPDFIIRYYLVANDFSCTGPINPNWPATSSRKETWDTYLYFEVRDPTIMLPTEARLRYRWNEYQIIKKERE